MWHLALQVKPHMNTEYVMLECQVYRYNQCIQPSTTRTTTTTTNNFLLVGGNLRGLPERGHCAHQHFELFNLVLMSGIALGTNCSMCVDIWWSNNLSPAVLRRARVCWQQMNAVRTCEPKNSFLATFLAFRASNHTKLRGCVVYTGKCAEVHVKVRDYMRDGQPRAP